MEPGQVTTFRILLDTPTSGSIWGDVARLSAADVEEALAGGPDVRR